MRIKLFQESIEYRAAKIAQTCIDLNMGHISNTSSSCNENIAYVYCI